MYHLSLLQMLSAPCWSGNTILTPELSYHILSGGLHANGILHTVICSTATAVLEERVKYKGLRSEGMIL